LARAVDGWLQWSMVKGFAGGRHGEAAPARVVGGHRGMGSSSAALNTTTMSSAGATVVCARDGGDLGLLPLILSHPHCAGSSSAVISGLAALASPTYIIQPKKNPSTGATKHGLITSNPIVTTASDN
jgi:hypothetical protein